MNLLLQKPNSKIWSMIERINGMKSFQHYNEEVIDFEPKTELGKFLATLNLFNLNYMHLIYSLLDHLNQSLTNGEHNELKDALKNDPHRYKEKYIDLMTKLIEENFPDIGEDKEITLVICDIHYIVTMGGLKIYYSELKSSDIPKSG